jgi:hypothetical protein
MENYFFYQKGYLKKENDKIMTDLPYPSTVKNPNFITNLIDQSKIIILKYLKKVNINKKKSDFKYEAKSQGIFNASIYSILI